MKKRNTKEQTVVLTIEATYILKDGALIPPSVLERDPQMFPIEEIDLNVCPNADHVEVKKMKVFEREE